MNLFNREKTSEQSNQAGFAEMALKSIHDGVIMTDKNGVIKYMNPAAATLTDCGGVNNAIGLDYGLILKLESKEGRELSDNENPLVQAIKTNQPLESFQACLIAGPSEKRVPIAISTYQLDGVNQNHLITFRDIAKELAEEGEQMEFISTASHEMRTPVATIDGYLALALNPQTASIDERARKYLDSAHAASQHLGKLFQDLLDTTKLDDGRIRPSFQPVELIGVIKQITDDYTVRAREAKINLTFGPNDPSAFGENRRMSQVVYSFIDPDFMREIMDNIVDNALKYTPEGGSIYINVRGDGDRALINVTDTGIGISADDLSHIFQKFYRADNSDTREIGGTGLGLYLVKQRVEAMGGKVWAESAFGEGSTFYISLPRLSSDEYEKRMIAVRNQQLQPQSASVSESAPQSAAAPQFMPQYIPQPQPGPTLQSLPPQPESVPSQPGLTLQSSPPQVSPIPPQPQPAPVPQPNPQPNPQPQELAPQPFQNQTNNNLNGEVK